MRIRILGAAGEGGLPHWNCMCGGCRRARARDAVVTARTRTTLAVSRDGQTWALLDLSTDLPRQVEVAPELQPRDEGSPVCSVVLTNASPENLAGLFAVRGGRRLGLHATPTVLTRVAAWSELLGVPPGLFSPRPLPLGESVGLSTAGSEPLGIEVTAFPVPDPRAVGSAPVDGNVGLRVSVAGDAPPFYYVPACGDLTPELADRLFGAALVFFDGTSWPERDGAGGHMSLAGPSGALASFAPLRVHRKVFVQVRHDNPILRTDTPERRLVEAAGWQVAYDGLELII